MILILSVYEFKSNAVCFVLKSQTEKVIRLILLLTYPDGHSDLASLMPKNQLSINMPVD